MESCLASAALRQAPQAPDAALDSGTYISGWEMLRTACGEPQPSPEQAHAEKADATYRHDADVSVMFAKQRLILSLPGHDAYAYCQARLLKRQNHTAIVLPGVVGPNWI